MGEGASGVVYRARHRDTGEVVALKVLRDEIAADPVLLHRFRREAAIAAEVPHPHLVPVLDAGEDDGQRYLASRYVSGESLADRLARGPLELQALLRVVGHAAAGLDALHRHGLVHRDVKTSNIMLDADGTAALTDFGLARGHASTALTRPGRLLGTLAYLAPELIRGERATPATDVYALGCVAYACATGSPPFASGSVLQVGLAHLEDEPRDPLELRPDLPAPLGPALLQALAKHPHARPRSPLAYAELLRRATERATPRAAKP